MGIGYRKKSQGSAHPAKLNSSMWTGYRFGENGSTVKKTLGRKFFVFSLFAIHKTATFARILVALFIELGEKREDVMQFRGKHCLSIYCMLLPFLSKIASISFFFFFSSTPLGSQFSFPIHQGLFFRQEMQINFGRDGEKRPSADLIYLQTIFLQCKLVGNETHSLNLPRMPDRSSYVV